MQKSIIRILSLLLVATLSAIAADTEWGKGAANLSDWRFSNYNNVKSSPEEISGVTICQLGVISPFLNSPLLAWESSPDDMLAIEIKCSKGGMGALHFRPETAKAYTDEMQIKYTTPGGDGQWRMMFIPLKHYAWKGKICNLRLALRYEDGLNIAIRRIKLMRKEKGIANVLENGDFKVPGSNGAPWLWSLAGNGFGINTANGKVKINGKGTATFAHEPAYIDFLEKDTSRLSLSFKAAATKPGTLTATIRMQGAFSNHIDRITKQWKVTSNGQTVYDIPEFDISLYTARVLFSLQWECAEESTLEISPILLKQREAAAPKDWSGEWIRPGDKPDDPPRHIFFRKHFNLPQDMIGAWLLINCDNILNDVFINGKKLPETPGAKIWNAPDMLRVDEFVKPGDNLIAVHGYNFDALGGLIAEIAVRTKTGWNKIGTDATWMSVSDEQKGWETPAFDDSKWFKPIAMGKGPGTPFGSLPIPTILEPSELIIKDLKASCIEGTPARIRFSAALSGSHLDANGQPMTLDLRIYDNKYFSVKGFRLASIKVPTDKDSISGEIAYPDFLPSGKLFLRLESQACQLNDIKAELQVPETKRPPCPATFKFTKEGYAPYLQCGDKSLEIIHHWCGGSGQMTEELMGNARNEHVPFYMGNEYSHWGWRGEGKYDFSGLDSYIYKMLELDPNARFSMQIAVDNYHNREFNVWLEAHPSECAMREDGTTVLKRIHSATNVKVVSYASKPWRDEMYNALFALAKHLREAPFGHRAISLQPISGMGGEWCYWGTFSTGGGIERLDYSRPFRQYFSQYAIDKYGSLEKLNAAWGTEYAAPEEIRIPSTRERDHNDWFEFIDAKKNKRIIDFRQSFSELIANDVITMCKAIKTGSNNQMYAGTFYGYITYVTDPMPGRTEGGHFALGKILNSPHVDYLTHLLRYADRNAGEPAGLMTPESSMLLHGKVPFVQADIRTHRVPPEAPDAIYSRLNNLKEGIAVIQRDFCNALLNGVGYEFGYYGHGWIAADRRMMRTVGRCREIEQLAREKWNTKRLDTENYIAVIVDDVSTYYSSQTSPIHNIALKFEIPEFYHTGVGMDTYLLEDIDKMPEYKCYIFLNT
ncbi:MAG: family 14 glycosylhydrolase, partial [Victivallales bacterium]|nr:family 14 glycosylhydrolase [Victivallales bacterium]